MLQVQFSVASKARPDRPASFDFSYKLAYPQISSLLPSSGTPSGGQSITVSVTNFPYQEPVGITVGQTAVAAGDISVSPVSNSLLTVVTFKQPALLLGVYDLRIFPAANAYGVKAASLPSFAITDPLSLSLLAPSTTSGPLSPPPSFSPALLRIGNYPSYATSPPSLTFPLGPLPANGTVTVSIISVVVSSTQDGVADVTFTPPSAPAPFYSVGTLQVAEKTLLVPYEFFDERATRVVSLFPPSLPLRASIYGRFVEFASAVSTIEIANFDQSANPTDVSVIIGTQAEAALLSVAHSRVGGYNRTLVRFRPAPVDTPVVLQVAVSVRGRRAASTSISFFKVCDYESFCGQSLLIADMKVVADSSPSSSNCEWRPSGREVCVSPNMLSPPSLVSAFPTFGPASGGTRVTVRYSNFPAFQLQDVSISAGSGASSVYALAETITPNRASSLLANSGTITFLAPRVPGGDTSQQQSVGLSIIAAWGEINQRLSFRFEYTPVITGSAVALSIFPASLPPSSALVRVTVQASNLPVVSSPSSLRCSFDNGTAVSASSISSSSFASTTASFLLNTSSLPGAYNLSVWFADYGPASAALFGLYVDQPTMASVPFIFPPAGMMGSDQRIRMTLLGFPPSLPSSSLSLLASLPSPMFNNVTKTVTDRHPLAVTSLQADYAPSCKSVTCTRYTLETLLPLSAMPPALMSVGMTVPLNVTSAPFGAFVDIATSAVFVLLPPTQPKLLAATPPSTRSRPRPHR